MPTANRILVYQRHGGLWQDALKDYKALGLQLGVDVFTRRERCYKGPERCVKVWTESAEIAADYELAGIDNDLGH